MRDFLQAITQCSAKDAFDAENEFCSSQEAQKALMVACGGSVASTAYGVYLVYIGGIVTLSTGGTAAATTVPAAAVGAVMGLAGGYGIKRYCIDLVSNGIESVSREQVHYGAMRKSQEP
jgi:hypothetical protein